jgi:hypothetical protein
MINFRLKELVQLSSGGPTAFLLQSTFAMMRFALIKAPAEFFLSARLHQQA